MDYGRKTDPMDIRRLNTSPDTLQEIASRTGSLAYG
ncbi:MAG: hypothetical protein QOI53_4077 [Verrucomicrobiota bacterium]|jgi:hypothetical protein|nr:hypothetical protein [Verrucomicrobiota bacterium]